MNYLRFVLILFACVGMSLGGVYAQEEATNGGTVRGQITDITPAQNPIEGVEVKIVAQDGGKEWTTKTDADGNYKHAGLHAGRYLISISKDGYDKRIGKPVTVVEGGDHFVPLKTAKKGNIKPPFELQPGRMSSVLKPRIESLRQLLSESIGKRYDLDKAAINTLRLSIPESVETALEQDSRNILVFGKVAGGSNVALIKMLLSHPVCKAAFAEHLSEAQLQDYLDFTEARRQLDQQAVARWITVAFDKELSLTVDQRGKIVKLLHGAAQNRDFPVSMSALRISPQQAVHLVHYRLKISLDDILSEAQSKVWQGLVSTNANREHFAVFMPEAGAEVVVVDKVDVGEIVDPNKKRAFIHKEAIKPVKVERKVNVVINEVIIDPPGKLQPWIELNPAGTAASPEQMMEIAEAKLVAHTELLGSLDERAARRLALVAKGVAQQYTEAQDKTHDAMDELWGDEGMNIDITDHPMYQQVIKDVLSEEAFAQYSTYQAEREVWHQQVLRDLVVACMDTQLLLGDTQREALETAASQLIPGPLKEEKPAEFMFFQLFPQTVNFEILTLWQQNEFKRVFGPMMWRR
ncbi:MAG: carboxypeptidase-like regulatory domain-containing protein [Candidatus Poribacteria bacterium]|nr:carboxypeptidase-like regulatory domain-containing protein [Candidatus Poribacteria bacterium]